MSKLYLVLCGYPVLLHQGEEVCFRTQKALALFVYLAVEQIRRPGRSIAREQLTDLLWPGMPLPSALQNLRQTLYQIRKALPIELYPDSSKANWLIMDRKSVQLQPQAPLELDVQEILSGSPATDPRPDWPEAFLKDFYIPDAAAYEEWIDQVRHELRTSLQERWENLFRQAITDHGKQAINYARHLVQLDSLSEKYNRYLMEAYVDQGQRTEALRTYQQFELRLRQELDTTPSDQIVTFKEQIRKSRSAPVQAILQPNGHEISPSFPLYTGLRVAGLAVLSLFILLVIQFASAPPDYSHTPPTYEAEVNGSSLPEAVASVHPRAYAWYEQGREAYYHPHPDSLQRALKCFQTALTIDPDFTLARVRLAMAYCTQASSWGNRSIDEVYHEIQMHLEAIGRDPGYRSAYHMIRGWAYFWIARKEQAVQQLRQAVQINPDEEFGYSGLCLMLTLQGKYEEARRMGLLGLERNPHLFWNHFVMGNTYYYAGAFEQAEPYLRKAIQMNPKHSASHIMLSRVYAAQGNYQKAIEHLSGVSGSDSYTRGQLGVTYLQKGQKAEGLAILEEMKQQYAEGKQQQCYYIAMLYNMLGKTETVLCWLERSVAEKENELNWLEVDHEFRNLHDHPHFQRIVQGLPQAFAQNLPISESSGE